MKYDERGCFSLPQLYNAIISTVCSVLLELSVKSCVCNCLPLHIVFYLFFFFFGVGERGKVYLAFYHLHVKFWVFLLVFLSENPRHHVLLALM